MKDRKSEKKKKTGEKISKIKTHTPRTRTKHKLHEKRIWSKYFLVDENLILMWSKLLLE